MSKHRWATSIIAVVSMALVGAGCTGGDDDADAPETEQSTTSLPSECEGISIVAPDDDAGEGDDGGATTTTLPPACADAVFAALVADQGSDELTELEEDQLLGFGRGLCAYALALADDPDNAPTYDQLITSTSESWGVDEGAVEEVLGFAATLCPGALEPVLELRDDVGEITVEMVVTGGDPAQVTYTVADGGSFQDEVTTPWESQVVLDGGFDFSLVVSSAEGEATCTVTVNDEELARESAPEGDETTCAATSAELRAAAR